MPNEPNAPTYEPVDEQWPEDDPESELPARPRRRLLGVGGNPTPLILIGILLIACGFIGGVLVEKSQSSSSSAGGGASGIASRFAALRGAAGASAGGSASFSRGGSSGGSGAGLLGGGGAGAGPTVGQVSYVSGHTLYVTTSEGNTIKVTTSAGSTVSKTVKSDVKGIHPGETVIVTGSPGANGAVSAEAIRVSEAGASGGLGALFGGGLRGAGGRGAGGGGSGGNSSGGSGGNSSGSSGGGSSGGGPSSASGEPALFGK